MQGDVRFAVLGPVRAWRDEAELDLGHPRQRAVLAALLVRECCRTLRMSVVASL